MTTRTQTTASGALDRVRELLDQNRPEEALNLINHRGEETPEAKNARAVCLLRLGRFSDAISILRDIAFRGYLSMPDDAPPLFQLNFATALLMVNLKDGAIAIMDRLEGKEDPQAVQLREAIERWKKSLGLMGRLCCRLGFYPRQPVELGFRPGRV